MMAGRDFGLPQAWELLVAPTAQSQAAQARVDAHLAAATDTFVAFDLRTMRIDSVPLFDLYIQNDGEYVLYRHRNLPFDTQTADNLRSNGVSTLYVMGDDEPTLAQYCEQHLTAMLHDERMPMQERASAIVRVAENLGRDIVVDGQADATERSLHMATALTAFVSDEPDSMNRLINSVRDGDTLEAHSANTSVYAVALARHAPDPTLDLVADLAAAGLLHDTGLTFLPRKILDKPTRLTVSERKQVELHPVTGEQLILQSGGMPETVTRAIRSHHERLDGSGYPDGLRGWAVPWMARAVAIAEVFDSLTSTQPWRERMKPYDALRYMLSDMRSGLDTELIRALIPVLRRVDVEPDA